MSGAGANKWSTIRSFVRREGKNLKHLKSYWERLWPIHGIDGEQSLANIAWPRRLEIGFGTGEHLYFNARTCPQNLYLGVEVYQTGICQLLKQIDKNRIHEPCANLKLFCGDVVGLLGNLLPNSLSGVDILFPDPWPKKKHHKRRLLQTDFFDLLFDKIVEQGHVRVVTDWEDYARSVLDVAAALKQGVSLSQQEHHPDLVPEQFKTKFGRKGIEAGRVIHEILVLRG